MPFTPFHFGPAACVALPLHKRVDFLSFLLVNVAIDLEPLAAIHLNLNYPLHGYAHTFIGAVVVGILSGWALYALRRHTAQLMSFLRLDSTPSLPIGYIFRRPRGMVAHPHGLDTLPGYPAILSSSGKSAPKPDIFWSDVFGLCHSFSPGTRPILPIKKSSRVQTGSIKQRYSHADQYILT